MLLRQSTSWPSPVRSRLRLLSHERGTRCLNGFDQVEANRYDWEDESWKGNRCRRRGENFPASPLIRHQSGESIVREDDGDRNRTTDTCRPDEERSGVIKEGRKKRFTTTRDSRPRDSNRSIFRRTISNHLGSHRRQDQRRGDPQEDRSDDRCDDRMRQNNRPNPQRTNSSHPSSNHPDQRPGDPQEGDRNHDRMRQNDRSNPQ